MSGVNLVRSAIIEASDARAYTLLVDGETQEVNITYAELDRQARQVAAALQRLGLRGERVLLVYPFGIDFNIAVLGCIYAGAVSVLAYPPLPNRPLTPLENTASNAQARAVLTTQETLSNLQSTLRNYPTLNSLHWISIESLLKNEDPDSWRDPNLGEDAPAFLSYTSGSTSNPRGVLLTYGNLLASLDTIKNCSLYSPGKVVVSCSPMNHISNCVWGVAALQNQTYNILIPTQVVLEQPFRWMQAVSRYRAQFAGGFNFLFQLSIQRVSPAERDTLDLSSLESLGIGGERVDGPLLERFAEYYRPAHFQKKAIRIWYGLTESSTIGTSASVFRHQRYLQNRLQEKQAVVADGEKQGVVDLVSVGKALVGKCVVVEPETHLPCVDQQVGEIWIGGPHVAAGYWREPEITAETFQAFLRDSGEGPFLRTGDLGFMQNGELYITGRLKDIIILRGQNYYSPDFEQAAAGAHPAMVIGGTAAVGLDINGEEHLAIVQEVTQGTDPGEYDPLVKAIRAKITAAFEQPVYAVILVEQGKLPRTMSRKIQRYRCLQDYLEGRMQPLKTDTLPLPTAEPQVDPKGSLRAPRTPIEGALLGIWMGVLKPEKMIAVDDNFFAIGGNSLHAAQVAAHVRDVFHVELPMQVFFEAPTIAGMAQSIEQQRSKEHAGS